VFLKSLLCLSLSLPPFFPLSLPSPSLLPPFSLSSSLPLSISPSLSPSLTQDFFATIVFGVFYVIADIAWSAGIAQLAGFVRDQLRALGENCLMCNSIDVQDNTIVQTFAQPTISVVYAYHVCVCIHVCVGCVCACPVCLCVSMYVCVYVCLCVLVCVLCGCVAVCVAMCMCMCMCVCVCVYVVCVVQCETFGMPK